MQSMVRDSCNSTSTGKRMGLFIILITAIGVKLERGRALGCLPAIATGRHLLNYPGVSSDTSATAFLWRNCSHVPFFRRLSVPFNRKRACLSAAPTIMPARLPLKAVRFKLLDASIQIVREQFHFPRLHRWDKLHNLRHHFLMLEVSLEVWILNFPHRLLKPPPPADQLSLPWLCPPACLPAGSFPA